MPYELCRRAKTNGTPCRAAALHGESLCFFHTRLHLRHTLVSQAKATSTATPLVLPLIEDRESVQVAVSLIIAALASGHLEDKRAASLLRALQVASRNLNSLIVTEPHPDLTVRTYTPIPHGLELANRRMSDNSTPPKLDPADPTPYTTGSASSYVPG